jgi:hypothetical protein
VILQPHRELTSAFPRLRPHVRRRWWVLLRRFDGLVEGKACCGGVVVSEAKARVSVSFPSKSELWGLPFIGVFIPHRAQQGDDLDLYL